MNLKSFENKLSDATIMMEHSFIREILKVTKEVKGIVSLAGGLPHPDAFPKRKY